MSALGPVCKGCGKPFPRHRGRRSREPRGEAERPLHAVLDSRAIDGAQARVHTCPCGAMTLTVEVAVQVVRWRRVNGAVARRALMEMRRPAIVSHPAEEGASPATGRR